MVDLATTQRIFLDHLMGDDALPEVDAADPARRMGIYRNAYRMTLRDALRSNHRRCAAWLGDDLFDAAADDYAAASPSPFRNLRDYGGGFGMFLAARFPDDLDIAELAALDWAIDAAFDGADADPLSAADIGALPPDDWVFRQLALHPAATLIEATHNLAPVWQALEQEQMPPDMVPLGRVATLLIWRMEGRPHFRTLEPDEDRALRLVSSGGSFGDVCEKLGETLDEAEATQRGAELLRTWLSEGVICWA